jgi:hypothetical protein
LEFAGTIVNALVVGCVGLMLAWFGKGRFDATDARLDRVDTRLDRLGDRVDELRSELSGRLDALSARMDGHIERHAG